LHLRNGERLGVWPGRDERGVPAGSQIPSAAAVLT